jgi:hypothetical protein
VCKAQGGEHQVSGAGIEVNQGIRSMQGTRRRYLEQEFSTREEISELKAVMCSSSIIEQGNLNT